MKKLISIMLTACICLSLLGDISFAGAEGDATEITFDFTSTKNSGYNNADDKVSGTDWYWNCGSVEGASVLLQTYGIQIKTAAVGQYVALTINVPVAGKYFPELYHYQRVANSGKGAGGYGAVYLIPGKADENAIKAAIKSGTNKELSGIQYFSSTNTATYDTAKSNVPVELFAGENTLVFAVESASDSETYANNTRMWPTSLTLKPFTSKTYTFINKNLEPSSWDGDNPEYKETKYPSTIVPVKDYGTHGYKYFDADNDTYDTVKSTNTSRPLQFSSSGYFRLYSVYTVSQDASQNFNNKSGAKLALAFEKPYTVPSFYAVSLCPSTGENTATKAEFYMEDIDSQKTTVEEYTVPESRNGTSYNFNINSAQNQDNELDELVYCNGKNDLMISFFTGAGGNLRISSLTLTPVDVSSITLNAPTTLEVDETSTVKVMAGEKSVVDSFVTYTVTEETDVIDIAPDGTVTAKAVGTATITATVGEFSATATIEVTEAPVEEPEEPEAAPTEINYGVFVSDANCASAVTANGTQLSEATDNIATGTLNPGATLTATAEDNVIGYKFHYWVLGSAATGRYYSSENTVTVNPYANIALTAIYTEVEEETKYLDFFNWNGDYVDSKAIADGKVTELPTATLTGYEFAHWLLEDNVTKLTSENYAETEIPDGVSKAMAQYTALNGYDSSNKPEGTSEHGWTRDGKLVSYSKTYEFFTWLNEVGEIKAYDTAVEDKVPLVVLERITVHI